MGWGIFFYEHKHCAVNDKKKKKKKVGVAEDISRHELLRMNTRVWGFAKWRKMLTRGKRTRSANKDLMMSDYGASCVEPISHSKNALPHKTCVQL